jgi:hypothetical protein
MAVGGHEHRYAAAAAQQQGFVADLPGIVVIGHRARAVVAAVAAIPARDDPGAVPGALQRIDQGQHDRGLAGTADDDVPDHPHRDRQRGPCIREATA